MNTQCLYGDPTCPCQDGDACHYQGDDPMNVRPEYVNIALGRWAARHDETAAERDRLKEQVEQVLLINERLLAERDQLRDKLTRAALATAEPKEPDDADRRARSVIESCSRTYVPPEDAFVDDLYDLHNRISHAIRVAVEAERQRAAGLVHGALDGINMSTECPYGDPACLCQDSAGCRYQGDDPMPVPPKYVHIALGHWAAKYYALWASIRTGEGLARIQEREACAALAADHYVDGDGDSWGEHRNWVVAQKAGNEIAAAIRARSEQPADSEQTPRAEAKVAKEEEALALAVRCAELDP